MNLLVCYDKLTIPYRSIKYDALHSFIFNAEAD